MTPDGPGLSLQCGSIIGPSVTTIPLEVCPMKGPAKNRLHDYEAGWLTLLLQMGVAKEKELREAQNRVAQAAIDEMQERRERRRAERERKRRHRDD